MSTSATSSQQPAYPAYQYPGYGPPPGQYPQYGAPAPYGQPPAPYGQPPAGAYPPPAGQYPPPQGAPPVPGQAGVPPQPAAPAAPGAPAAFPGAPAPPMPHGALPPAGAEVWYAGVKIVDPNTPAAPSGSFKVPGYDPKDDFEKFKQFWALLKDGRAEENKIVTILLPLTLHQRDALNDFATAKVGKDISSLIEPYTFSSEVRNITRALVLGPLGYDVELLNKSLSGIGTNEMLLTELILNRPQQDLKLLKEAYKKRYGKDLVDAVKSDLSGKFERLFVMALALQRTPDTVPVDQAQVTADVDRLVKAGKSKEEIHFIEIFVNRSHPHLAAVITQYGQKHKSLSKVVKKAFSGDLENALLYILHGVKSKRDGQGIWRDAKLLEKTMAGLGTRDSTLVYRVMRAHFDKQRFAQIKTAYRNRYGKELDNRIKGETSGPYRDALLAVVRQK